MLDEILAAAEAKSGKTLKDLVADARAPKTITRAERVKWLRDEHGLGRTAANAIAARAEGKARDYHDQQGLLDAMYAGPKTGLKPIYDRLVQWGRSLGAEFRLYQCAGQTTFKRNRQFAWVKPATRTRVDLGLAIPGVAAGGRLKAIKGTNDKDRVRLRIELTSIEDVDAEVTQWLRRAWSLDA